jgi:hypothetical protein
LKIINGEMEYRASANNKAGSNAFTAHSDTKRNIPGGDSFLPLLYCRTLIPLTHKLIRADCGYQVPGAERKINHHIQIT